MGIFDSLFGLDDRIQKAVQSEQKNTAKAVEKAVTVSLAKAVKNPGVLRYAVDPLVNNQQIYSRKKPDSQVSFDILRKFSVMHEISRMCINTRKRQLTSLEWEIVPVDEEDKTNYKKQIDLIKTSFAQMGGKYLRYRKFMDKAIEDLLVLDAVAIYKQKSLDGNLFDLTNIDASTIRLRVAQDGSTPIPPEIAYKQVIRGKVVAELTADEMVYEMMNPRTNTPYGLAPLESLLITVQSSLKAALANDAYLTEGNIPEGLFGVPSDWSPQMIQDFQAKWDAVMSGDEAQTQKLKFVPEGSYQATKKPNDMAWEQFNMWLLKVTCAIFDVQPIEIGFEPQGGLGGKGFSEGQDIVTDRRAIVPLCNFFSEIFNSVIQEDMGFDQLSFKFTGIDAYDARAEAERQEILIRSGQRSINEARKEDGLEPIEGGDVPFVIGKTISLVTPEGTIDVSQPVESDQPTDQTNQQTQPTDQTPEDSAKRHVELVTEMRKFRRNQLTRIKRGFNYRKFESDILPSQVVDELNQRAEKCSTEDEVKGLFREFMQDYQIQFLDDTLQLKAGIDKVLKG